MNPIKSIRCIKVNVYTTMIKVSLCFPVKDTAAIGYSYSILVRE